MISVDSIQQIAKGVVETSSACDGQLYTGTVTSSNPLKIKLGIDVGDIELEGDDIILTECVVSKKLYIKKHTHGESSELTDMMGTYVTPAGTPANVLFMPFVEPPDPPGEGGSKLTLKHEHEIEDTILDAWVTEYGHKLNSTKDDEQICITINRSLQKGDSVIMSRVSHGQQFIVLSRYFPVDKAGDDDEGDE